MTLIADGLLDSLDPGNRSNKTAMKATLIAFDGAIAGMQVIAKPAAEWAADETTILSTNQIGLETDTGKFKFGDGSSTYGALAYSAAGSDGGNPSSDYPEGISKLRIRDSNGDAVMVGDASDGTIVIDDEIRAVAKLGATTVSETAVTGSRALAISDIQFEVVTGEGLPSAVTERTLVCLASPASTAIALTIGNTAGATRNWPILVLVDPDQTGAVTLALVENGTINGVAGTGTWQFYANRPTPILIRNPTGTAPIVTTGAMIEDGKATILSDDGTLTVAEHNQRIILATDDVTVPAIVGLQGVIVASGASRDVTFGTDTIAVPDGAMLPFVVLTATSWLRPPDPIENAVGDGS